jgi:hypothetical protein
LPERPEGCFAQRCLTPFCFPSPFGLPFPFRDPS